MKRKGTAAVIAVMMLSGCAQTSSSLPAAIDQSILKASSLTAWNANRNKAYYSYYIEPSIGRYDSNSTGNVFSYRGTKFVMDLNVPVILNQSQFPLSTVSGADAIEHAWFGKEGSYIDSQLVKHTYSLQVFKQDKTCLILFNTDVVNFYSIVNQGSTADLCAEMLKIARSVEVHKDPLAADYANAKTLNYVTNKIQLYHEIVPESGVLSEIIDSTTGNVVNPDTNTNTDQDQIKSDKAD